MNSWIGTSGFQYSEWKGSFYPEDLPAAKMLPQREDKERPKSRKLQAAGENNRLGFT